MGIYGLPKKKGIYGLFIYIIYYFNKCQRLSRGEIFSCVNTIYSFVPKKKNSFVIF